MTLKAVLVGTGGWAENHIRAYRQCRKVELVGICGHLNVERLDTLASTYGIPNRALDLSALVRERVLIS